MFSWDEISQEHVNHFLIVLHQDFMGCSKYFLWVKNMKWDKAVVDSMTCLWKLIVSGSWLQGENDV